MKYTHVKLDNCKYIQSIQLYKARGYCESAWSVNKSTPLFFTDSADTRTYSLGFNLNIDVQDADFSRTNHFPDTCNAGTVQVAVYFGVLHQNSEVRG